MAQQQPAAVRYFTEPMVHIGYDSLIAIDTTLHDFQFYDPFLQLDNFYASTGNISSPHYPLIPVKYENTGFSTGFRHYALYRMTPENLLYYNTFTPFTHLQYQQGDAGFQQINALHTRNFTPGFNVGLHIHRLSSEGKFLHQRNLRNSFRLFTSLHTNNQRYLLLANGWGQNFIAAENGGIVNYTQFRQLAENVKNRVPVNIMSARHEINKRHLHARQFYFFGKDVEMEFDLDIEEDTIEFIRFQPKAFISHSVHASGNTFQFMDEDPSADFYPILMDSNFTHDSIRFNTIENTLLVGAYNRDGLSSMGMFPSAAVIHTYTRAHQRFYDTTLNSIELTGVFDIRTRYFNIKAEGKYHVMGDYTGNHDFVIKATSAILNEWKAGLKINTGLYAPAFTNTRYESNHYPILTEFSPVEVTEGEISFEQKNWNFNASLSFRQVTNHIYYGQDLQPRQSDGGINILSTTISKNFNWRGWYFKPNILLQQSSDDIIIPIPEMAAKASFYHQRTLYRGVLLAQFGINGFYHSLYYAPSYITGLGRFASQTHHKLGNYPYYDVFFNAQVDRFRLSVLIEHVNQGYPHDMYFLLPYHPYQTRSLRLGISWMFYD